MKKIKLGNSDLTICPISFGAWAIGGWMWGGAEEKDALAALDAAISSGMTSIDTAAVYGFGKSEKLVGKAIKGRRDKVEIFTKFGLSWSGDKGTFFFRSEDADGKETDIKRFAGKDSVIRECEESLKRLGTDYIDLYQIHWPDPATDVSETMEALTILKDQGKIRAAGVSNYDHQLLDEAHKSIVVASDQVPYSMVNRGIEEKLVPYCLEKNIGILAYSPMQRGLLTGKFNPDSKFKSGDTRPDTAFFKAGNIAKINTFLEDIRGIADNRNVTLAQLVLRWTVQQPGISSVLAGARDQKQVEENVGAANFSLSEEEMTFINQKLNQLKLEL